MSNNREVAIRIFKPDIKAYYFVLLLLHYYSQLRGVNKRGVSSLWVLQLISLSKFWFPFKSVYKFPTFRMDTLNDYIRNAIIIMTNGI